MQERVENCRPVEILNEVVDYGVKREKERENEWVEESGMLGNNNSLCSIVMTLCGV